MLVSNSLKTDIEKGNLFYNEGFENHPGNAQYSFDCAKEHEKYAKKLSLPKYIARTNFLFGILYSRKNDLITALSYYKKALAIYTDIDHKQGIAAVETNLGNLYGELKRYKLAEDSYLRSLEINNDLKQQDEVGNCLLNLGVLKAEVASSTKDSNIVVIAKNYFDKALENSKARNDYELEAKCLNNLAVVNTILHQFESAIANCINSIKVKDIMDNEMEMADSYLNMAVVYMKSGENKLCYDNLNIADSIIKKYNYLNAKIQLLKLRAEICEKEKKFELAYGYLITGQKLKDSLEKVSEEIILENNFNENNVESFLTENKNEKLSLLFFNILIILAIAIAAFVFKFKR